MTTLFGVLYRDELFKEGKNPLKIFIYTGMKCLLIKSIRDN